MRNDVGPLWENFCIVERIKYNHNHRLFKNYYFWRIYSQKEIDFIEEAGGKLTAFEFKWDPKKTIIPPHEFMNAYPHSDFNLISRKKYLDFINGS